MEFDSENLISLVFTRKALWDKTTKEYRNRLKVDKLWRQVSNELGGDVTSTVNNDLLFNGFTSYFQFSADAVKKKWKNLRNSFGKELRKIPEGRSGNEGPLNFETYTTWPYFDSMLFLKDQMRSRKSGGNLPVDDDDVEEMDLQENELRAVPDEPNEVCNPDLSEIDSVIESIPQPSFHRSNRPVKRSAQLQLIAIEARKLKLLERKVGKSNTCDDDEDGAFFKSLLPHVRKLEPEEKLEFRMEIQSVVQKYVYKKNKLLNNPNIHNIQSSTPLRNHVPLTGVETTPLSPYQRDTQTEWPAEILSVEYQDDSMSSENQYSTIISTSP